jgi:hypothetical protein
MPPFLRLCAAVLSRSHGQEAPKRTNKARKPLMQSRAAPFDGSTRVMVLTLIAMLALVFLRSVLTAQGVGERMVVADNDSIMRFLSVRDWLDGQGWFDMSNDRVLPPEGLSLHWSRYIDLALAGVIGAASVFLPHEHAEAMVFVLWPGLLMVCFLTLTMVTTRHLFGPRAAAVAIMAVVLWRLTGYNHFGPMVIDHHGLQILLLGVVVFTLVVDGPEVRRGVIGGAAAAMSLAVGLENLLPIVAAGVILSVLAVASNEGGHRQLKAFGLTLFGVAVALYLGQTAPAEWGQAQCDELGPPILGLVGLAATAALVIGWTAARTTRIGTRAAVFAVSGLLAGGGAVWIMQACPNFPYGNLPDEIRELIGTWISEAQPATRIIAAAEPRAFSHLLPTLTTTVMATLIAVLRWRSGRATASEARAVAILLVFAWIGALGVFAQSRMNVLSAPVIPILMGYCLTVLLDLRRELARPVLASLASVAMMAAALFPGQLHFAVTSLTAAHAAEGDAPEEDLADARRCRSPENIAGLNALPEARILGSLGLTPPILLGTHHSVVSAPYHRSADALGNGFLAFLGDEEDFFEVVDRSRPDYFVMCPDGQHAAQGAFIGAFVHGETVEGFTPVTGLDTDLIVLRVTR